MTDLKRNTSYARILTLLLSIFDFDKGISYSNDRCYLLIHDPSLPQVPRRAKHENMHYLTDRRLHSWNRNASWLLDSPSPFSHFFSEEGHRITEFVLIFTLKRHSVFREETTEKRIKNQGLSWEVRLSCRSSPNKGDIWDRLHSDAERRHSVEHHSDNSYSWQDQLSPSLFPTDFLLPGLGERMGEPWRSPGGLTSLVPAVLV